MAEKKADTGAVDAGGVGRRGLGEDDAGVAGGSDGGDGAELKGRASEGQRCRPLGLSGDVRNGDLLRTDTFRDADGPLAANGRAGGRELAEDVPGWGVARVELVFEAQAEAEVAGFGAGLLKGEPGEVGDHDLAAVDGEAHRQEGREKEDGEHCHGREQDIEKTLHRQR